MQITYTWMVILLFNILFISCPGSSDRKTYLLWQENEKYAIQNLKLLFDAQTSFQSLCLVDQDKNGIGEYGALQELAGTLPLRGKATFLSPPFINESFGKSVASEKMIVGRGGYYYIVYCS